MYFWTNPATARDAEPSPLLIHLAGAFADRIAKLWPAPHTPFLTAGANQRHLIAIGLSRGSVEADLRGVVAQPIKRALRTLIPGAPQGLTRAIGRLGEALWPAEDYARLLAVLHRPEPAKVLAHAPAIEPALVQVLEQMPAPLVAATRGGMGLTGPQAALVTEAFAVIERREGPVAARRIAERWARSKSIATLVDRMRLDILPELPAPPFAGGPRLKPLPSKAAVVEAGRRYDNCLRYQVHRAVDGSCAFYEWVGETPAIVEVILDPMYGWRLNEVKLRANAVMPEAARPALLADLRAMGVHVGRNHWDVQSALQGVANAGFALTPVEEVMGWAFAD